jgi:hypothetical protein
MESQHHIYSADIIYYQLLICRSIKLYLFLKTQTQNAVNNNYFVPIIYVYLKKNILAR